MQSLRQDEEREGKAILSYNVAALVSRQGRGVSIDASHIELQARGPEDFSNRQFAPISFEIWSQDDWPGMTK